MNRLFIFAAVLSVGGAAASMVEAHHSFSMFDPSREEVVEGTVIRWAYNSPHTLLFIKDGAGKQWVFEGAAPPALLQRIPAMSGTTFTPGQHVMVVHCPLRDGRRLRRHLHGSARESGARVVGCGQPNSAKGFAEASAHVKSYSCCRFR